LSAQGRLFLYGPFKRDGRHTAPSNAAFDAGLRRQDPEWGVRDIDDIETLATSVGLRTIDIVQMPANNLILIVERSR
jgi:predicted RNA-binding protein with PUA-like domain